MKPLRWCIFCRVIDNWGDAGVCLRLARELAARGQWTELWIDQPEILDWMEPSRHPNLKIIAWPNELASKALAFTTESIPGTFSNSFGNSLFNSAPQSIPAFMDNQSTTPVDVIIEAFGCEIPDSFKQLVSSQAAHGTQTIQWINLEYLTAESYAEQNHRLLSPVLSGPGEGAQKWFFYPGFTPLTGGLILEHSIRQRIIQSRSRSQYQSQPQPQPQQQSHAPPSISESGPRTRIGLFCYAHAPLQSLLYSIKSPGIAGNGFTFNIAQSDAQRIMKGLVDESLGVLTAEGTDIQLCNLPQLNQDEFDDMLWANDLNFVRGEDSLIRAIWVGKPWIWQIYQQTDDAHVKKLNALLDLLNCPEFVKEIHWGWNQHAGYSFALPSLADTEKWSQWRDWCLQIRSKLAEQADLVSQLTEFVDEKRQKTVES